MNNLRNVFTGVVLLFVCALIVPAVCTAASAPSVGLVDLRALIVLHPRMADYDINSGLFKVHSKKKNSTEELKKLESEIVDLNYRLHQFNEQLLEYQAKYDADMKKLNDSYQNKIKGVVATASLAYEGIKFSNTKEILVLSHKKNVNYVNAQISLISKQIDDKMKQKKSGVFVDHMESQKIKEEIKDEVLAAIKKVASSMKLAMVLNSSAPRKLEALANNLRTGKDVYYSSVSYKDVLHSLYVPFDHASDPVHKKMDPSIIKEMEENSVKSYYADVSIQAKRWLALEENILSGMVSKDLDSVVLFGGVDITTEVLDSIFKEYEINKYVKDAVLDILRK